MEFQPEWLTILQSPFIRNALIGGSLVAIAAGLLGYFVITRQNAFAAHALAHIGFPGATGTILALVTALGILFASLASANAGTTSVLFGNLLAISCDQLLVFTAFTAFVVLTLAVLARPLVLASVDPWVGVWPATGRRRRAAPRPLLDAHHPH